MTRAPGAGRSNDAAAPATAGAAASFTPVDLTPLGQAPLVSVLIANKDYGRFLADALEGILSQTYLRWEAIVCDDGSCDDSVAVVRGFMERDERIRLVAHDEPEGQAAAFNTAYECANGDVIVFLDADDTAEPNRLERIVAGFRQRDAGLLVHPLQMFDERGPIQRLPALSAMEEGWLAPSVARRGGRWRWVPTSGAALRRQIAELVFPMPVKGLTISADTYFLVLAPLLTPVAVDDHPLGGYRRHGANGFARGRIDPERAARAAETLRVVADEVNGRLTALGRPAVLKIEDNLKYRELMFQASLLGGSLSRPELWTRCGDLLRRVRADDIYGGAQKTWAVVLYRGAVLLPLSARASWLSKSLSGSRLKERVRHLVGAKHVRRAR